MAFIVTGTILIFLVALSFWLAYSEILQERLYVGWIFLVVFLAVFLHFCMLWFKHADDVSSALLAMAFAAFVLITQWPFALELFSRSFIPDASRNLKVIKTYSAAERKVIEEDFAGAIEEYEKVIAEDPDDVTARFRLADLCYQNKNYPKAVKAYKALVARKGHLDIHQHCSALMRLSEIHAQNLDDPENARRYLEEIIREHEGTKFAGYARDRLNSL